MKVDLTQVELAQSLLLCFVCWVLGNWLIKFLGEANYTLVT